jgi:hypothetical protein
MTTPLNWSPVGENLLIEPDPTPTHAGDIELPEAARIRPKTGTILAAGPLALKEFPDLAPRTRVMWLYDLPSRIMLDDGREYLIASPFDIALAAPYSKEPTNGP